MATEKNAIGPGPLLNHAARSPSRSLPEARLGELLVPCPLISRGRPSYSSDDTWIALHAGVGPSKLLVSWAVSAADSGADLVRMPSAYLIETSATSTNGRDGQWRHESSVASNTASARTHVIEFDGQSWVRMTPTAAPAGARLPFARLDLHDASDGTDDCWLVFGDATRAGLTRGASVTNGAEPSWADLIHERYPGYFPALVDASGGGEAPARTLERLAESLATHPATNRVAIAPGAASSQTIDADAEVVDTMVTVVLQSGRLPVLARSFTSQMGPRDAVDALNRRIAAIEQRHRLVSGPDLAAWFDAHPDQLDAEGQPTLEGRGAIVRLWADAVDVWYVPQ